MKTRQTEMQKLQTRREFFKKAAKGVLPILGMTILGPAILSSCEKEDPDETGGDSGGSSSSGGSKRCSNCSASCFSGRCTAGCSTVCTGSCKNGCYASSR